jgi:hypothetical protein
VTACSSKNPKDRGSLRAALRFWLARRSPAQRLPGPGIYTTVSPRFLSGQVGPTRFEIEPPILGLEALRRGMRRGLVGFGVCIAGAGVLACFAAVGALGLLGQLCAHLLPGRAQHHQRAVR